MNTSVTWGAVFLAAVACGDTDFVDTDELPTDDGALTVEERRDRIRQIQEADAGCTRVEHPPSGPEITTAFDAWGWPDYLEIDGVRYEHTVEREGEQLIRYLYDTPGEVRYTLTFDEHGHIDSVGAKHVSGASSGPTPSTLTHDADGFVLESATQSEGRVTRSFYDDCERVVRTEVDGEVTSRITPHYLPDSCLVDELVREWPKEDRVRTYTFEDGKPVRAFEGDKEWTWTWTCP